MHDQPLPNPPLLAREALRRACAALDLAELSARPFAMSQALARVARCYLELDAPAPAEACFERAVSWARLGGTHDHVVELLCELADASAHVAERHDDERRGAGHAARERARDHAFEASVLAASVSDASCEAHLLLRVCAVLERCGDRADALQLQVRALDLMAECQPADVNRLPGTGRPVDG